MSVTVGTTAEVTALRLAASVVWERPAFTGPERSAAELAEARPEWLLSLLVRVPALRAAVRARLIEG